MDPASDCVRYTSETADDVWFSFMATSEYTAIDITGTMSYDVVFQVFSGSCGALQLQLCVDDNYPDFDEPTNTTETATLATAINDIYYIRVYSYFEEGMNLVDDTFTICAYEGEAPPPPPANDECTGAVEVALSMGSTVTLSGDNTGATEDEGIDEVLVWNAFSISECSDVTLDFCSDGSEFAGFFTVLVGDCGDLEGSVINGSYDECRVYFYQLPAGTYYVPVLVDEEATPIGEYSFTATATSCDAYCVAFSDECDEFTARFVLGDIDNSSLCGPTYSDYTDQSTELAIGTSYPVTVENNPESFYPSDVCTVWVDWDQDQDLGGDGETFTLTSDDDGATFTGSIEPPAGALLGATRLRVRMAYDEAPDPCNVAGYGDVEDYTVLVTNGTNLPEHLAGRWSIFPNPTNGDITIKGMLLSGLSHVEVRDMTGRIVYTTSHNFSAGELATFQLAGKLATGTYNFVINTTAGRTVRPVIVR